MVGVMTISTDVDKLYDTDLTDAAWALIAPMLPAARPGGRPRKINIRGCVERNLLSTANRLPMAFASPRVSRVEHGIMPYTFNGYRYSRMHERVSSLLLSVRVKP
jgi:transposase